VSPDPDAVSVCLFTDSLAPSGVGEHMLTLAAGMPETYALSFVCPPSPSGDRLLDRASSMGLPTLALEVRGDPHAGRQLRHWLREQDVQLFHGHAGVSWEGHEGIRTARDAEVPWVVRTEHLAELMAVFRTDQLPDLIYSPYHHPDHRFADDELIEMVARDRAEHQQIVALVDRLICVSAGVRDSFVRSGVPAEVTRVVRNGITPRPQVADGSAARERLGMSTQDRIVLTIGRFIDVKGHHYLLDAVPDVVRRQPDVRFVWVGGGPMEQELRERVASMGLDGCVCFAGQRGDVPDLLAAADLFLLPSLVEGLPLVVLEAMAAGLPVVGTRVPGTSEVVADGVTGRLVPPGELHPGSDAAALVAAILEGLDPDVATAWGQAGRSLVYREFTGERMADETAAVYDELLR